MSIGALLKPGRPRSPENAPTIREAIPDMTQLTRLRPPAAHTRPGPARVDNAADVARVMARVNPFAYPTSVKVDDRTMTVHIMRPAKKADAVQLADSIGAHVHVVHEEEAPFLHYWVGHTDTLEVRVCWIGDDE